MLPGDKLRGFGGGAPVYISWVALTEANRCTCTRASFHKFIRLGFSGRICQAEQLEPVGLSGPVCRFTESVPVDRNSGISDWSAPRRKTGIVRDRY